MLLQRGGVRDQGGDTGGVGVWPGRLPSDDPRGQHEDPVRAEGEKERKAFHTQEESRSRPSINTRSCQMAI